MFDQTSPLQLRKDRQIGCEQTSLREVKALTWLFSALLLTGCARAGMGLPPSLPATTKQDAPLPAAAYEQLYRFPGAPAGSQPTGLVDVRGRLYGTTMQGGSKTLGTVFVRGRSGKVRILHSFGRHSDGADPNGTLVELNGKLYGTTQYGGAYGDGAVFSIERSGIERVLYSFKGGGDGANPLLAGMVAIGGKLYGTTNVGGDMSCKHGPLVGCGTVFTVTTSGRESVLYQFTHKPDGANPSGPLTQFGSTIYGTTNFGGKSDDGSVFSITTSGTEKVLYSFKGDPDGTTPFGGVILSGGWLYGTTALGGAHQGAGTVFELSGAGTERVLHSFRGTPDGALPYGPLVAVGNRLLGLTEFGGRSCVGGGIAGCGTVFSVTPSGKFRLLYRFKGQLDGAFPLGGLVVAKSGIYGTTTSGGSNDNGTIFQEIP